MNKIVASLGMVALGASGLSTASAQDAPPQKFWNVSASLRGFYDDNINTAPNNSANKVDSFGFQVSPGIGLNWENDSTKVVLGYQFDLRYYDQRPADNADDFDKTHIFRGSLNHTFSERYSLALEDSFVIGQEPDVLRPESGSLSEFQRISGDNIRNDASIAFNAQLTPLFGTEVGYRNGFYDYDSTFNPAIQTVFAPIIPSSSGALDRVENTAYLEGQWKVLPQTTALAGYQFRAVNFTGDEAIQGINGFPATMVMSDSRDSRSHYGYVGVTHVFMPDFSATVKGGAEYIDFYNKDETEVSPYFQAILTYLYAPESTLRFGFTQQRTPIYNTSALDSDTSSLFGSVRHRIVPNLFGTLTGTFQNSTFNGGANDGDSDRLYQVGINLEYVINQHLSTEIGYNFDRLESDVVGNYDRNRVYIGVTARY